MGDRETTMPTCTLDRYAPMPLYKQVADLLRERISQGEFLPGDPLPSEEELRGEYRISRATARRAHAELRDAGIAHNILGRGTFFHDGTGISASNPVTSMLRQIPIYQQIAAAIVARIRGGELHPHRGIPSENVLVLDFRRSKKTVRHALQYLRDQGWVYTIPRRGT